MLYNTTMCITSQFVTKKIDVDRYRRKACCVLFRECMIGVHDMGVMRKGCICFFNQEHLEPFRVHLSICDFDA